MATAKFILSYQIKNVGDTPAWEFIPATTLGKPMTEKKIKEFVANLANGEKVYEIRYTLDGSLQGNYVSGSPQNRDKHLMIGRWRHIYQTATSRTNQDEALKMIYKLMDL